MTMLNGYIHSFILFACATVLVGSVPSYIEILKEVKYCTHPQNRQEEVSSGIAGPGNSAEARNICRPKLYLSINIQNNAEVSANLFL